MERELGLDRNRCSQMIFSMGGDGGESAIPDERVLRDRITPLIQEGGPNSVARRNAAAFQYDSLRQLILPYHKQYLLWLSLKEDSFFTIAKEKRSKTGKGTGRVSSKHVGDELTATHRSAARFSTGSSSSKSGGSSSSSSSIACSADDAHQSWPLVCFELGVSLDQEEKLLNAFRRVKQDAKIPSSRKKLSIATTMSSSLKDGVLYQSHSASERNETALLRILTPSQTARFQQWIIANRSRCNKLFGNNQMTTEEEKDGLPNPSICLARNNSQIDPSLSSVCQQLTEALKITKKE